MEGPVTRSRSLGCSQFQSLSFRRRQRRHDGPDLTGSVELDKSCHAMLPSKRKCTKTFQSEPDKQPCFPADSGAEVKVLDTPFCMFPQSPSPQPSSFGNDGHGQSSHELAPNRLVTCETPGSSGSIQPARVMRCDRPGSSGGVLPARVMRCERPGSSGMVQPAQVTWCETPGSSGFIQPARIMSCERPGSSGGVLPARVMRCERPGSSGVVQPAQVTRCETPGSFGSIQPARIMSCERSGSSGGVLPARVMQCERPGSCGSIQPARVMRCERPGSSGSTQPARVMRYTFPSSASSAPPSHNSSTSNCPDETKNLTSANPLDQDLHLSSKQVSHELGGKDKTATVLKGIFSGLENMNTKCGGECIKLAENAQTSTSFNSLKRCCGDESLFSLRALKSVSSSCEQCIDTTQSSEQISQCKCKEHQVMTTMCQNGDSYFNQLPNEVLCMIFSHLPRIDLLRICSKVCLRWSQVAKSSTLWQTLSFCGQDTPIQIVCGFIRLSPSLKSITLKDRLDIDVILPVLHQQCKHLQSVNIVRCKPIDGNQKTLRAKSLYPLLKRDQLCNLSLKGTDYRSKKFYQMLSSVPSLKKLNISCSKGVSPQILEEIAKLTTLKVFKHKWHSNSIYYGDKSMTIQLPGRIGDWGRAYSKLFREAGQNLTTLEIYAAGISDSELSSLASCKQLRKLAVFNANCFGSESTAAVATLPNLRELLIHNAKLTTVDVANAFQTGNLSNLKCLHLNDSVMSNSDVTADACIRAVAVQCSELRHLSFTKCSSLTDIGVEAVLNHCPQLRSLDLNGGHGISGQSFLLISTKTPNLQLLVIEEDCSQEKNEKIKQLLHSFPLKVATVSTWKHRTTSYLL